MTERAFDAIVLTNHQTYIVGAVKGRFKSDSPEWVFGADIKIHPYLKEERFEKPQHVLVNFSRWVEWEEQ